MASSHSRTAAVIFVVALLVTDNVAAGSNSLQDAATALELDLGKLLRSTGSIPALASVFDLHALEGCGHSGCHTMADDEQDPIPDLREHLTDVLPHEQIQTARVGRGARRHGGNHVSLLDDDVKMVVGRQTPKETDEAQKEAMVIKAALAKATEEGNAEVAATLKIELDDAEVAVHNAIVADRRNTADLRGMVYLGLEEGASRIMFIPGEHSGTPVWCRKDEHGLVEEGCHMQNYLELIMMIEEHHDPDHRKIFFKNVLRAVMKMGITTAIGAIGTGLCMAFPGNIAIFALIIVCRIGLTIVTDEALEHMFEKEGARDTHARIAVVEVGGEIGSTAVEVAVRAGLDTSLGALFPGGELISGALKHGVKLLCSTLVDTVGGKVGKVLTESKEEQSVMRRRAHSEAMRIKHPMDKKIQGVSVEVGHQKQAWTAKLHGPSATFYFGTTEPHYCPNGAETTVINDPVCAAEGKSVAQMERFRRLKKVEAWVADYVPDLIFGFVHNLAKRTIADDEVTRRAMESKKQRLAEMNRGQPNNLMRVLELCGACHWYISAECDGDAKQCGDDKDCKKLCAYPRLRNHCGDTKHHGWMMSHMDKRIALENVKHAEALRASLMAWSHDQRGAHASEHLSNAKRMCALAVIQAMKYETRAHGEIHAKVFQTSYDELRDGCVDGTVDESTRSSSCAPESVTDRELRESLDRIDPHRDPESTSSYHTASEKLGEERDEEEEGPGEQTDQELVQELSEDLEFGG